MASKQVITVGRAPDNDVVLNETNVSSQHARLTISADKIVLEDLGSTNGTSVGTVEKKVNRAHVELDDTVFFGSTGLTVSDILSRVGGTTAGPAPPNGKSGAGTTRAGTAAISVACVTLIAVVGWIILGRGGTGNSNEEVAAVVTSDSGMETQTDTGSLPSGNDSDSAEEGELTAEQKLARALFVVICTERQTPFRVGTAFAIDAQHVVTTASVIRAVEDLQRDGKERTFLYSPATGAEIPLGTIHIHPEFVRAHKDKLEAQHTYDDLIDQFEQNPPDAGELESVKQKLQTAFLGTLEAIERQTIYDVAVIKVESTLSHWIPGAESGSSLRPNLSLTVTGLPHDIEDPYFDESISIDVARMTSRVRGTPKILDRSAPRLLASAGAEQHELRFFGSPAINAQGLAVAVYARPTPPSADGSEAELVETFDAPLFARVSECLPPTE